MTADTGGVHYHARQREKDFKKNNVQENKIYMQGAVRAQCFRGVNKPRTENRLEELETKVDTEKLGENTAWITVQMDIRL